MRTRMTAASTLSTLLVIGGCQMGPTATELDHGNSVRHMVQAQTLNPAGSDDAPVEETDSNRTRNTLKVYRIDVSTPRYGIVDTDGGASGTASGNTSQQR